VGIENFLGNCRIWYKKSLKKQEELSKKGYKNLCTTVKKEATPFASFFAYFPQCSCKIPFATTFFFLIYMARIRNAEYASLQVKVRGGCTGNDGLTDRFETRMSIRKNGINIHLSAKSTV